MALEFKSLQAAISDGVIFREGQKVVLRFPDEDSTEIKKEIKYIKFSSYGLHSAQLIQIVVPGVDLEIMDAPATVPLVCLVGVQYAVPDEFDLWWDKNGPTIDKYRQHEKVSLERWARAAWQQGFNKGRYAISAAVDKSVKEKTDG